MGKQSKSKRSENLGKGKVTPVQVAFIVDRYLSDNHFSETRSIFRSEASSLIAKSPVREAPKTLLTLDAILNEYICLKEQKVMLEQEKTRLANEKIRVQNLLQGMQEAMTAYNSTASVPSPAIQPLATAAPRSTSAVLQPNTTRSPPSDCPVYNTPSVMPVSLPFNKRVDCGNFMTPSTSHSQTRKRKSSDVPSETSQAARRTHQKTTTQNLTTKGPGSDKLVEAGNPVRRSSTAPCPSKLSSTNEPSVQGSGVAKCLFNKAVVSPPIESSCPRTPQETSSPNDTSVSPQQEVSPQQITPTSCTIVSKERITVSPLKNFACYTMSRSHCISSSSPVKSSLKRDHVKGRLDFDASDVPLPSDNPTFDGNSSSTSESDKEIDLFDMDFPNLDIGDFSFSELLGDLGLDSEVAGFPCQPLISNDPAEGSSPECRDCDAESDQVFSEYSSSKVVSGKDTYTQGPNAMTAVKSITKCIRIVSPAKSSKQGVGLQTTEITKP